MATLSFIQCRFTSTIFKDFSRIRTCQNYLYFGHNFHSKFSLQRTSTSFLAINTNDLFNKSCQRTMAGHAKWQNVKHIKEAKDREKNLLCNRYAYLLRSAVREGGADPKLNNKLSNVLEQAKKNNVPASVVENALKSAKSTKPPKVGSIEILGPGGCIVVMEYEADNISTMRHAVKGICKKYGANIMTGEGRWRAVFEKKGIIKALSQKDGQPLDAERALDSAIEAGAEEVQTKEDENEKTYLEFICGADDLHPVKKEIEKLYEVEEGYVGYLPINKKQLDEETMTLLDGFLEDLGNMTEVIRIFENAE